MHRKKKQKKQKKQHEKQIIEVCHIQKEREMHIPEGAKQLCHYKFAFLFWLT